MNEIENLRELYLADLGKIVNYGGIDRSRVAYVRKWKDLPVVVKLSEGVEQPVSLEGRKVWMWSDLHLWHKNIIAFSERPYDNLDQMHKHLLLNHNEIVGKDDIVIWGGDVGFKGTTILNEMLAKYNGYKILVVGNHDFSRKKLRNLAFDETHLIYTIETPEVSMLFTHYPMYNVPAPWVNVHGHLHAFPNPVSNHPRHLNINCEVQGYKPVSLETITKRAHMLVLAEELK